MSRPLAVMPTLTECLAAAATPGQLLSVHPSLASLANLRSAFTPVMPQQAPASYHNMFLLNHFNQLYPNTIQMAQQQRHWPAETDDRGGRTKSSDSRSSLTHASRHQAAEQRRRSRINDRRAD